jgi:glutathione S-transferase
VLDEDAAIYSYTMMDYPYMKEWTAAAKLEPDELEKLDVEF